MIPACAESGMKNSDIHIIDLEFLDLSNAIATFLIPSDDGLILIESGPESTYEHLIDAIKEKGVDPDDIKHVLLTHIHFDHAGAAWKFAEKGAKIYVHPIGLPHLQSPERLWNSAKMIYGDDMDRLWGEMKPIDENKLVAVEDGDEIRIGSLNFKVHYTPGHAIHHNAYQLDDTIFVGDVGGIKIKNGPVVPPCPPPDIDLGAWKTSIDKLKALHPKHLVLTHFGFVSNPIPHLDALEVMLHDWADWMKPHYEAHSDPAEITPKFVEYTKNQLRELGVPEKDIDSYDKANPSWMSVMGLLRYWKLKDQGRL